MPANVHRLRGNPGHKSNFDLTDSVNPEIETPGCPKHLLPEARKEWKRIAPELEKLRLISKLDRASLAIYCQEYAWLAWHETCLQRDIAHVASKRAIFEEKRSRFEAECAAAAACGEEWTRGEWTGGEWTGGDGYTIPTPNGSLTYNPHWVGRNKAADKVSRYQALFGLSPSARGRVTPSANQLPLPGFAPAEGFNAL